MIEVIVSDPQTSATRAPSFQARIFAGPVLCRSVVPVYEAARALLARGHDPDETMVAYDESTLTPIFKPTKLRHLSIWTVTEGKTGLRRVKWVPHFRQKADSRCFDLPENAR